MTAMTPTPHQQQVEVWDLPTRLFHWGLVICFIVSWASASLFDNMQIHYYAGYTMLTLVLFRIVWGFAGSSTARFSHFVRGPRALIAYARSLPQRSRSTHFGHNPGGGWAVLGMLGLLLLQAATGLFSNDEDGTKGPLAHWVSDDLSDTLSTVHSVAFDFLLGLIGLHIAAVLFYRFFKQDNLIVAMITGRKTPIPGVPAPAAQFAELWRAALAFALIAGGVAALVLFNG